MILVRWAVSTVALSSFKMSTLKVPFKRLFLAIKKMKILLCLIVCADQIISGYPGRDLIQIADHHSGGEVAQGVEDNLSKRLKIVGYCPKSTSSELLLRTSTGPPRFKRGSWWRGSWSRAHNQKSLIMKLPEPLQRDLPRDLPRESCSSAQWASVWNLAVRRSNC